jgi:hypothetical protein
MANSMPYRRCELCQRPSDELEREVLLDADEKHAMRVAWLCPDHLTEAPIRKPRVSLAAGTTLMQPQDERLFVLPSVRENWASR